MRPVLFKWDGQAGVMRPATPQAARLAVEQFAADQLYPMVALEDRSPGSHKHYFAALKEAWNSLPESLRFEHWAQSVEALRHYALIRTGFCTVIDTPCSSEAAALRVATMARGLDEYAIAQVSGSTVRVFRAKSQSNRSMAKPEFEASKEAVLRFVADLIGVTPETLAKQEEAA